MPKLIKAVSARGKKKGKKKPEPAKEPARDAPPMRSRRRRAMPAPKVAVAKKPKQEVAEEPEAIAKARARLKVLLKQATDGAPDQSIGLVLAILNQETGNTKAANVLIDDYGLEKAFGLKKF